MKIKLILHNIRSTYNVGAIIRTAEGLGISQVILSGYTPRYNDPAILPHLREKLNRQIEKSALGAEKLVSLRLCDNIVDYLTEMKLASELILGLENNLAAEELSRRFFLGSAAFWREVSRCDNREVAVILGEEVNGIPEEVRSLIDIFAEIPMSGQKESFNVSVAAGITMFVLSAEAVVDSD